MLVGSYRWLHFWRQYRACSGGGTYSSLKWDQRKPTVTCHLLTGHVTEAGDVAWEETWKETSWSIAARWPHWHRRNRRTERVDVTAVGPGSHDNTATCGTVRGENKRCSHSSRSRWVTMLLQSLMVTHLTATEKTIHYRILFSFDAHCCHMGIAVKHPVPDRVKPSFCNFWHPGTLAFSSERQSARMSKITNDGLTRSVTGCFIAAPTCGNSGRQKAILTRTYIFRRCSSEVRRTFQRDVMCLPSNVASPEIKWRAKIPDNFYHFSMTSGVESLWTSFEQF